MRLCLIVNPHAGKKHGDAIADAAAQKFQNRSIEVEAFRSTYPGHAVEIAAGLTCSDWDGIIAVGGDGTLFEIVNGLLRDGNEVETPIGQIPVGTGNSFLRDLGVVTADEAVETIAAGRTRPVDVGRFTCADGTFHFVNLLGAGFVSNVAYRAGRHKRLGALSYIIGVFEELIGLKPATVELTTDGRTETKDVIFVEICNSKYTGGTMMMAPNADLGDGAFDVVVLSPITRRKLLALFPTIFKGTHIDDPAVEVIRAERVTLDSSTPLALTPDGETFGTTPIEVSMRPKLISMFTNEHTAT